jgi:ABC-type hemin transport system ATPase subunit
MAPVRGAARERRVDESSRERLMTTYEQLLPAQRHTVDALERAATTDHVVELFGRGGAGKTTILRVLHERLGGRLITSRDFIEASLNANPLALDETVYAVGCRSASWRILL